MLNKLVFVLCLISFEQIALAQDVDDPEAEAFFMSVGRYYKSIKPIINKPFEWSKWETTYDSTYKFSELSKIQSGDSINWILDLGDEDELEVLPVHPGELHFLDLNGDGNQDLIYQSNLGYRGHRLKIYFKQDDEYVLAHEFSGMLVGAKNAEQNEALTLTIYEHPCCDGYAHHLKNFVIDVSENTMKYRLSEVKSFFESNLKRYKNLPDSFSLNLAFSLKKEALLYYFDVKRNYPRFRDENRLKVESNSFHPFAQFPQNAGGIVLATKEEESSTQKRTWYFVRFDGNTEPVNIMKPLTWGSREVWKTQEKSSYQTIYYGWIYEEDKLLK